MKKQTILFLLFISCLACNRENDTRIKDFYWLEGTWISENDETLMKETWKKSQEELEGKSIVVIGIDTVFSETVFLQEIDDTVTYTVYLQGNSEGTAFKLIHYKDNEAVFENAENDFPQRIVYRKQGSDSLYARIEGEQAGKFSKEEFLFRKEK